MYFLQQQQSISQTDSDRITMGQTCKQCSDSKPINYQLKQQEKVQYILRNLQKLDNKLQSQKQKFIALGMLKDYNFYQKNSSSVSLIFNKDYGFYQGQVNQCRKAEGKGRLVMINYNQYKGQFKNGQFHGSGVLKDIHNDIKFQANWSGGKPLSGEITQRNGETRIKNIQIMQDKKYKAQIQLPNKIKYNGELVQKNKINNILIFQGKGTMQFPDKSKYEGQFLDGKFHGKGKYSWKNGNYYDGGYKNGVKSGQGTMYWKQHRKKYTGIWFNGQPGQPSTIYASQIQNHIQTQIQPIQ